MKTKHSDSTWNNEGLVVSANGKGIIAQCPTPQNGGVFECVANAKLIAAAPDLIDALKEAIEEIEYWPMTAELLTEEERNHPRGSGWARVYDKAKAAIKKATA